MNFALAPNEDWDYFAELTGDKSWSAKAMDPYFIDVEDCLYVPEGTPRHGFNGFISSDRGNLSYLTNRSGVVEVLYGAAREAEGVEIRDIQHVTDLMERDMNTQEYLYAPGIFQVINSVDGMKRRSSIRNHITGTIEADYPLTLSPHSLATRVLFSTGKSKPKAYGVEYMVGEGLYGADRRYDPDQTGQLRNVTATKEVIVAGGTFNTPQILKLSGVGPREELESFGIPVIVDLPGVGMNLQDHTESPVMFNASAPWDGNPTERCTFAFDSTDPCFVEWQNGTGPYGESGAALTVRLTTSYSETGNADIWLIGLANAFINGFYPGYSYRPPVPSGWSWAMVKAHMPGDEFSSGTVILQSADPRDPPVINFDWLRGEAGERDLLALTESVEFLGRIFDGLSEHYTPVTRHLPAAGQDIAQALRDESFGHHAASSCRMGPVGDPYACVDSELRVNGVEGLRVVDASVFPYPPGSFPFLPTYMMGLKAADLISKAATS
ncbi:hypothetical protein DL764_006423 [Monosporascus ibericus]|uniref:Glucose-methanol-choline oxidoreductase N-terminal domain-containing protein n=1 Tax=Monosporascus ibericus TaxID=155417 RepID=A0A4Q4T6R3_9PEZI|nr:hypothetical protein DL764_006423 [Monosporascus ibericus]